MNQLPCLSEASVRAAIEAIRTELQRRGTPAVIAVADPGGDLLGFLRMDGAPPMSGPVAINKAFTAARTGKPSRAVGTGIRERGHQLGYYGDARFCGWAGGVPVLAGSVCAGAVAVSGLSQDDDEAMAQLGAAAALAA